MALQKKKHKNNDLAALTIGYYKITISVKGIFTYAHDDKKISYYISVSIFLAVYAVFVSRMKQNLRFKSVEITFMSLLYAPHQ